MATILGIFLIAHGLVHAAMSVVPLPKAGQHTPFWPTWWRDAVDTSWPVYRLGWSSGIVRAVGCALWIAAMLGFICAGAGLLGIAGLSIAWHTITLISVLVSGLMFGLFWHPWLVVGAALDIGLLVFVMTVPAL
jgi:hypothetical protein